MTIKELRRLIDEARDALQMPDNPPYCPVEMIDRTPNDAYATETLGPVLIDLKAAKSSIERLAGG